MTDDKWVHFKEINIKKLKPNQYHLDTRDFHVFIDENEPDFKELIDRPIDFFINYKDDRFIFTPKEVNDFITHLFETSGEDTDWRLLTLEGYWVKYIRVYKISNNKYIIASESRVISKNKIEQIKLQ